MSAGQSAVIENNFNTVYMNETVKLIVFYNIFNRGKYFKNYISCIPD